MTTTTITTVRQHNLWCEEGTHDKLYRLEMTFSDGRHDVFAYYGRRGGKMTMHIWASDVKDFSVAYRIYTAKLREKLRKGYREIAEDAAEVGTVRPTWRM